MNDRTDATSAGTDADSTLQTVLPIMIMAALAEGAILLWILFS